MNWKLKAVVQKGISFLPAPFDHKVNYLMQKYVTKGVQLSDAYFLDRLEHAQKHITAYQQYAGSLEGIQTLELGTGWYPVVPISLFLVGAEQVRSLDLNPLTHRAHWERCLEVFVEKEVAVRAALPILEERWAILQVLAKDSRHLDDAAFLAQLRLSFLLGDARELREFKEQSIQLIHSNNTFEHVHPAALRQILQRFQQLLAPKGLMSHFVDMSDHFAHADPNITIYNFLQFTPKQWARIDNEVQPQNRWRLPQYLALYQELGLNLLAEEHRPGRPEEVKTVAIDKSFSQFTVVELAVSHVYLWSR